MSDLALLPAVHVSSDEPSKATDEHTLLIPLTDDQPKAPACVPAFELSEPDFWRNRTQGNTFEQSDTDCC